MGALIFICIMTRDRKAGYIHKYSPVHCRPGGLSPWNFPCQGTQFLDILPFLVQRNSHELPDCISRRVSGDGIGTAGSAACCPPFRHGHLQLGGGYRVFPAGPVVRVLAGGSLCTPGGPPRACHFQRDCAVDRANRSLTRPGPKLVGNARSAHSRISTNSRASRDDRSWDSRPGPSPTTGRPSTSCASRPPATGAVSTTSSSPRCPPDLPSTIKESGKNRARLEFRTIPPSGRPLLDLWPCGQRLPQHQAEGLFTRRCFEIGLPAQGIGPGRMVFTIQKVKWTAWRSCCRLALVMFVQASFQVGGKPDIEQPILLALQHVDTVRKFIHEGKGT